MKEIVLVVEEAGMVGRLAQIQGVQVAEVAATSLATQALLGLRLHQIHLQNPVVPQEPLIRLVV